MITLLGYSFFCILTLAAPDVSLIARDAKIKVPKMTKIPEVPKMPKMI